MRNATQRNATQRNATQRVPLCFTSKPLLMGIAVWGACSKKGIEPEQTLVNVKNTASGGMACNPNNPQNHLDSVGGIHNLALESVRTQVGFRNSTLNQRVSQANLFLSNRYNAIIPSFSQYLPSDSQINTILADSINRFSNIVNNTSYSNPVKSNFLTLLQMLHNIRDLEDYCAIKNQIINFEKDILADTKLNQQEKDVLLAVTSIARHTMFYWSEQLKDELKNEQSEKEQTNIRKKWLKNLIIGICDVAGGIFGAFEGTIAGGVVGGPAGAAVGAVAGAITIGSATSAAVASL